MSISSGGPGAFVFSVTYIGDAVTATLTFDAIPRFAPGPLVVVTSSQAAPLLRADRRLAEVREVKSPHPILWRAGALGQIVEAKRRNALVVNLEVYPPRWRLLRRACRLAGVPSTDLDLPALIRDSRASSAGRPFAAPHRSSYYARAVFLDDSDPPLARVIVDPRSESAVAARLQPLRAPDLKLVVVHAGSSEPSRRPPPALLSAVLRAVAARERILVVLIGTEGDRPACAAMASTLRPEVNVVEWAGILPITEMPSLLRTSDLFVGGDSGPLKVAEAVGARTVSLWGPTQAAFAGPRGSTHRYIRFASSDAVATAVEAATELLAADR